MLPIQIGPYTVRTILFDRFALDGGAMFGPVPKTIWSKKILANEENRIPMVSRSLLIEGKGERILVDLGCGNKWSEKQRSIYAIENQNVEEFKSEEITAIILTHLHFDHAAGLSYFDEKKKLQLRYPQAKHFIQSANLDNARNPNIRERASYLPEHVSPLDQAKLEILSGDAELFPGISVKCLHGHTKGMQLIRISDSKDGTLVFPSDLMPTSHHLPAYYHMGYDMCAQTTIEEKEKFIEDCLASDALIVFQHDADVEAGRLVKDAAGKISLNPVRS